MRQRRDHIEELESELERGYREMAEEHLRMAEAAFRVQASVALRG